MFACECHCLPDLSDIDKKCDKDILKVTKADLLNVFTNTNAVVCYDLIFFFFSKGCELYAFCGALFGMCSMITLMIIAVDRYFVITRPLASMGKMSYKRALIILTLGWLYTLFWSLPPFFGWSKWTLCHSILFTPAQTLALTIVLSPRCICSWGFDDLLHMGLYDVYSICSCLHNASLCLRLLYPSVCHYVLLFLYLSCYSQHHKVGSVPTVYQQKWSR